MDGGTCVKKKKFTAWFIILHKGLFRFVCDISPLMVFSLPSNLRKKGGKKRKKKCWFNFAIELVVILYSISKAFVCFVSNFGVRFSSS